VRRDFFFWCIIGLLIIMLGIIKQLDLQSLLTEMGRQVARHQGWMEQRRIVQFWFILCLASAAIAFFLLLVFFRGNLFRRFRLAFVGLFFLVSFIMIRAVGFHHLDRMLGFRLLNVRMNWVFELGGIYAICLAGVMDAVKSKNRGLTA
jgi:hypothetical protein